MCGIAGLYIHNATRFTGRHIPELMEKMLLEIKHRGPDEAGIYFEDHIALGTVRLAIIDIQNGQQPMMDKDRYVLNFNGEIFNYLELRKELEDAGELFKTQSDTEVVLKAMIRWQENAFSKFDGHFAISFYDTRDKTLLLARDPFGEKPLFYTANNTLLSFASEIKAFRHIPGFKFELDQKKLSHSAWFWTPLPGQTPFKNIDCVRPGHFLRFKEGRYEEFRYYDFPPLNTKKQSSLSLEDTEKELESLLTTSIKRRLRSDVEVASYLSGGLDSTIVTCLAREILGHKLKTFSVTFDDPQYDEAEAQENVAKALGAEHHTVKISSNDIVDNFEKIMEHAETPVFRTALTPMYLLSKHVQDIGIKVVLTGEGSDEFFMGYDIFKETLFREDFASYSNDEERIEKILQLYPYLSHFNRDKAQQLLRYFSSYTDQSRPCFSHELRFANGMLANQLLTSPQLQKDAQKSLLDEMDRVCPTDFSAKSHLEQAQIFDVKTLMEGYLLSSQGDRMTSANSTEGRCPFLSTEVIQFAQDLPLEFKLSKEGVEKKILRTAFKDKIPQENALRRKQPYRAPDAKPFLLNAQFMNDELLNGLIKSTENINPEISNRFINKMMSKNINQISPREDQAFVFMLSTLMVEKTFCRQSSQNDNARIQLKVRIDGTRSQKSTRNYG